MSERHASAKFTVFDALCEYCNSLTFFSGRYDSCKCRAVSVETKRGIFTGLMNLKASAINSLLERIRVIQKSFGNKIEQVADSSHQKLWSAIQNHKEAKELSIILCARHSSGFDVYSFIAMVKRDAIDPKYPSYIEYENEVELYDERRHGF